MLAKTKLAKLEKQLEQANARTRNLSLDDCVNAIARAEKAVMELSPEFRKIATFEYNPHTVAKSYKYNAEGTVLHVQFNAKGKAINVEVYRANVCNYENERLVVTYEDVLALMYTLNNGHHVTEQIIEFALKSQGFNITHLIKHI